MTTSTAVKKKTIKKVSTTQLKYSKKQYLKWYEDMLVMRKVEEKVGHFPFTLVELMDSAEYDEEIHQLEIKFEYEMDQIYGSM